MTDLPALLRDFAKAFPLDSIYALHRNTYRVYIDDYTSAIRREVAAALRYLRVNRDVRLPGISDAGRAVVIPNLLQSHDYSLGFMVADTFYTVEGPQRSVGYQPHEFVHAVTRALSDDTVRFRAAMERAIPAYRFVKARPAVVGYQTLSSFLDENLVRAILLRYPVEREPARDGAATAEAADEARRGLVLVPYFYEQLARYERQRAPFNEYYPRLFESLDAGKELARWPQQQ
jgi:hypothetical protein